MIVDLFLQLFYDFLWLITATLRGLQDVVLSSNITSSMFSAGSYLANINQVFPATTLIAILGVIISVEVFILTYKGINWLIRKIPTIS